MSEDGVKAHAALDRALRVCLLSLSIVGLLTLALTLAGRVLFPWPLEWLEGASLQHALRLLHAEPLYAAPSASFIPSLYPPLAYLPMALFAGLLGPSLFSIRLGSLLSLFGSLFVIGRAGARAAGASLGGWVAAGVFALGFGYGGAFLDLARVDAFFVLLLLLGAERLQAGRPRQALFWLALSAFAKQHGLLLLLAASLALLWQAARSHASSVAFAWLGVFTAYAALELVSAGWFGRYTLELPRSHGVLWRLFFSFFVVDLLLYLPVLVLCTALDFLRRRRLPALTPFDALVCAAVLASALGRAHVGGHDNVRLPALALLCIAGVAPLVTHVLSPLANTRARLLACAALALQLGMLWQAPSLWCPPRSSAAAFAELRATLQHCARGGRAVALDYALLTSEPFVQTMALSDLRIGHDHEFARAGTHALLSALRSADAPAAIAIGETFPALEQVLARSYRECARVPAPRLATGYSPGLVDGGRLVQIVYARAASEAP